MSHVSTRIDFRANVQRVPSNIPPSVRKATMRFLGTRANVVDVVGDERWEQLRQAGHDIRLHTINHLDHYLAQLETSVTLAGGMVHWATDAAHANQIVIEIAREHNCKRAVKVKSMASEEIGLNHALAEAGIQATETDLGEYIVQLAGTTPSHIIVPAVHLTKEGIADLFRAKLGVDAPPDPIKLCAIAREKLREEFLSAEMGISGANFMVADSGTLVIVTNEGNGRMCTTLPPLHVAIVGIDKVVPDFEAVNVLLKLLPRSATGQKMSSYTSFITGPRRTNDEGGPQEFHLVLLDNGRTRVLRDSVARETLLCIRCGVCLNVCPVYNNVGGHAYGAVYSGPIGSILAPQLLGTKIAGDLPFASTLCGACADYCPVKIPIPKILLRLRQRVVEGDRVENAVASPQFNRGARLGSIAFSNSFLYEWGTRAMTILQAPFKRGNWLHNLPPPFNRWTNVRPFPAFGADFRAWFRQRTPEGRVRDQKRQFGIGLALAGIATFIAVIVTRRKKR